ncbi:MAG TPA: aminotransferase class I/II-fold pyridoxal phosphate-dependent enzyme [Gemmataceae bacterium]|nr:aminotransferase class I/II-fold pyridoxal phosphate-dependent enzyme [Gemmataceae bacterium]
MSKPWIADRMHSIELSGIRKVFELARSLKDPVDFSIGQPHFDVPEPIKAAAKAAIDRGANGYTVTQGIPQLRDRLAADVQEKYGHADRAVMVTSGTSGALTLALLTSVNPGDEVIVFDPYFVSYPHMVTLAGGRMVPVETLPDFEIDLNRAKQAITPKTKAILVNSPGNPTGVVLKPETLRGLAELAARHDLLLISDEIYHSFCYDQPFHSPAEFHPDVLVVDGFGKSYGMTGWRMGFAHGPKRLIDEMIKLQQFTFVCAPSIAQHACITALDFDVSSVVTDYRQKRDRICAGLKGHYDFVTPAGAFYVFPRVPSGTGTEFVEKAICNNLLTIPGKTFSTRDTHFRLSYAVPDSTIDRGIEILRRLARL